MWMGIREQKGRNFIGQEKVEVAVTTEALNRPERMGSNGQGLYLTLDESLDSSSIK